MDTRKKRILYDIDTSKQVGLEIGPLSAPVVLKNDGEIYYLDHTSTAGLKAKYKDDPIDHSKIVEVDYILKKDLPTTVGTKKFDYVVAAHVIEHVPDMVSWLQEVADILKDGGILTLVIPDKRFTFDVQRQNTTISEIIGRYLDKQKKPSATTLHDFYSNYVDNVDNAKAWEKRDAYTKARTRWTSEEAMILCEEALSKKEYVDCHCSVFTPESFVRVLKGLIQVNLMDFEVSHFVKTQPYELEFYISLRKVPSKKRDAVSQISSLPKLRANEEFSRKTSEKQSAEIARLAKELTAIRQSLSWKVTRPLRYLCLKTSTLRRRA